MYEYDASGANGTWRALTYIVDPGDANELEQRLSLQSEVSAYRTTAEGGYRFVSSMAGRTYDPNNLPNP